MKKLLLGLLMMAGSAFAADTITPRLGLIDPEAGSTGWASKMTHNFNVLDSSVAILSSTQTFTGSNTFLSSTTAQGIFASKLVASSPTYAGNADLYVDGSALVSNYVTIGESGALGAPYIAFINNNPLGSGAQVMHSGDINSSLVYRAQNGHFFMNQSNSPQSIYSKRIVAGPDYSSFSTLFEDTPNSDENAFQQGVLIGTTTNNLNTKLLVVSSPTHTYSMVVSSSGNTYQMAVSTTGDVYIKGLASGECMQVGTGGLLTTTGAGCGSGGGGSSSLAVFEDTTKVSSPTAIVKFDGTDFSVSLTGGATAFVVLGDSITVDGITVSSISVRSIYWADGTVQVSSPSAGGGGSGDITGVAVSGEGITGGGTSGDVTIVLGSTVAYTTKNQTWTAPQNFSTNTILGNATFYHNASPSTQLTWDGRRILVRRDGSYTGGIIAIRNGDIIGSPPRNACLDLIADSGTEGTPAQVCNVSGSYISLFDSAGSAVFRGATSSGILLSTNTIIPGTTIYHNGPIATTVDVTVGGQSVCLEDGTNCPASGGSGGGYAVEPATVTFQLSKGVTASTGTFTDLLLGTTIQVTSGTITTSLTVPQIIGSGGGTSVLSMPHMVYVGTELGVGEGQTGAHVFHTLGNSKMAASGGTGASILPLTITATASNSTGNTARGLDITASGANVTQGLRVSASGGVATNDAIAVTAGRVIFSSNTVLSNATFYHNATAELSSATFRLLTTHQSSMTLSGGYLVQNIPPTSGQVLKFDGTNWAPGSDATGGGGGTTIWVQQDDSDVDVSVSTIDVRSPLTVTSSPSGEVNLDVDKSSFTLRGPDPTLGGALGGTISNATVDNDGHSHTGSTLSGIDVSDDTNLAASQPLVLIGDTLFLSTNVYVGPMGVSWDGGGAALTTGTTYWFPIPSSGTLTGFTLTGLPSGSVSINVSSSAIFNTGPVSICASACPVLSGGTYQRDTTLTGWAKTLAKDGFLYFVINSAGTSTQANLALEWIKL